ncbi:MAG: CooT family nickel-binding protein [Coriobacteriales bacterium]|nr:CooT family nickel-binding protein [Coriobacteriales bacterium]
MCISTAYLGDQSGEVLAEYVASVRQDGESLVLTSVVGADTVVRGSLKLADLTRGILLIEPAASGA